MRTSAWLAAVVGAVLGGAALGLARPATAAPAEGVHWMCKTFDQDLRSDTPLRTADATTPVGAWVAAEAARGWTVADVDVDVVQKATGFPVSMATVCLKGGR